MATTNQGQPANKPDKKTVKDQVTNTLSKVNSSLKDADPKVLRQTGDACFAAGFGSIALSILCWAFKKGSDTDGKAERLGIFVGLWAPTFFILSNRFERYADRAEEGTLPPV